MASNQCLSIARSSLPTSRTAASLPANSPLDAKPLGTRSNYLINVASYKNGIGYGRWTHIDGFSEAVFRHIQAVETAQ